MAEIKKRGRPRKVKQESLEEIKNKITGCLTDNEKLMAHLLKEAEISLLQQRMVEAEDNIASLIAQVDDLRWKGRWSTVWMKVRHPFLALKIRKIDKK